MNEVAECLIAARKRIEDPARWGKGTSSDIFTDHSFPDRIVKDCAAFAVFRTHLEDSPMAYCTLQEAVGTKGVAGWNDAPERTHEEVLAAFDKAIEIARAQ